MASSEADIQALIDKIDAEIEAILTGDGSGLVDYQVGDERYGKSLRLYRLQELRKMYVKRLEALPSEELTYFDDPSA